MEAKHRLTDMDFSAEGCHVSLVSKKVGGAANGRSVILMKSLITPNEEQMEMIEKAAHEEFVAKAVAEAVEPIQKALDAAVTELEVFKAAQVVAIEKSRKDALAEVMGTENPDLETEFAIVKGLDSAVFDLILKSKKAAIEAVTNSAVFKEVGFSGEADPAKIVAEQGLNIRKYQTKKTK